MKSFWQPPVGKFEVVEVPRLVFAMIDGRGDPNAAPAYAAAIQWLYAVSYGLKFASKAAGRDYGVAPLEGLWWAEDMNDFTAGNKDAWLWTAMIMQPDWTTPEMFEAAAAKAGGKLGARPPKLRLAPFAEGLSVQTMHLGPYSAEGPTIARLHQEFLPQNGLTENGHHHEIYLGDPRRTAPEKLKTVIRQPVRRSAGHA
ncbi:MAG: GyrI-like domain-containing protein [Devosia sp.]|nr:GyrI-like domain-containing protein [Devosia sp.]